MSRKPGEPFAIVQVKKGVKRVPIGESAPGAKWSDTTVATARRLHAEGMSLRRVGRALGVPWATVQTWIGKSGHPTRNKPQVYIAVVRMPLDRVKVLK